MEGQVRARRGGACSSALALALLLAAGDAAAGQESGRGEAAELRMRRSVNTREYQGKQIEGEERVIARGDSLWRILVQERGVSERRFGSYLVVLRGVNPQLKNLDVLRVGDSIFIPLRLDEDPTESRAAQVSPPPAARAERGATVPYQVKPGETLYRIVRVQLAIADERKVGAYAELIKDLNPQKQNWDVLQAGEMIVLPDLAATRTAAADRAKPEPASQRSETTPVERGAPQATGAGPPAEPRDPRQLGAREHLEVLARVVNALGGEFRTAGEEVVAAKDLTLRIDRSNYPVAYSAKLQQRVVLDPRSTIPAGLRDRLRDPRIGTAVLTLSEKASLQQGVTDLLAGLGYQSLPTDRPVVIQDGAVAFEVRGHWIVVAPEQSNSAQELYVINLTDGEEQIPAYLVSQLASKGLRVREVLATAAPASPSQPQSAFQAETKRWPADKSEVVDALLLAYKIPFGVGETFSIELRDGLRLDTRVDRTFELSGRRVAIFFRPVEPEIRRTLETKHDTIAVELDLQRQTSKELVATLLKALGENAAYQEHRFSAARGRAGEKLAVTAWGFLPAKQRIFVTDREIPAPLHRFFFEKGLEIVYFR